MQLVCSIPKRVTQVGFPSFSPWSHFCCRPFASACFVCQCPACSSNPKGSTQVKLYPFDLPASSCLLYHLFDFASKTVACCDSFELIFCSMPKPATRITHLCCPILDPSTMSLTLPASLAGHICDPLGLRCFGKGHDGICALVCLPF